jgi:hypothetical protein
MLDDTSTRQQDNPMLSLRLFQMFLRLKLIELDVNQRSSGCDLLQ